MSKLKVGLTFVVVSSTLLFFFQNCSGQNFAALQNASSSTGTSGDTTGGTPGGTTTPPAPGGAVPPTAPTTPALAKCDQTLSVGANIATAVTNAANDSTICLNNGDYGTINLVSIRRTGFVTVRSVTGLGAKLNFNVNFSKYIRLQKLTLNGGQITGCAQNIDVFDSTFTDGLLVMSLNCAGAALNVSIAGNLFGDIGQALYEGRLSIRGDSMSTIGVTVSNNHFGPGCQSDGIQLVGTISGTVIGPANVFEGINQTGPVHCDSIQLYAGGRDNVITGNWFKNSSVVLQHQDVSAMASHTMFTNNVISNVAQFQVGNSADFVFEHNTVYNLTDVFRFNTEASSNVVYRSNIILGNTAAAPGGTSIAAYNLCGSAGLCNGTNTIIGTPIFVGGAPAAITTLAGWALAPGSLGKNAGHDMKDVGH